MLFSAMLVFALAPAGASAAEPAPLSWTSHVGLDSSSVTTALSCPSQAQCTLLDFNGGEVTFDPQSTAAAPSPVSIGASKAISCPATDLCVATDSTGGVVTFDPGSPSSSASYVTVNANGNPLSISCPTTTLCVAGETESGGNPGEITFNPASPPTNATPISIDPGGQGFLVSCPAGVTNLCVAGDQAGNEVTFNPSSPSGAKSAVIAPHNFLVGLACPPGSTAECTGLNAGGGFITFNPLKPSTAATFGVDNDNYWGAFDCATPNACTALDSQGNAVTFDPTSTTSSSSVKAVPTGAQSAAAVSCPANPANPAAIECVALDYGGNAFVGTGTIEPPKPSCTATPKSRTVLLPPVAGQPIEGNEGQLVFNVYCRPVAGNVGVSLTGRLTEENGQKTSTLTLTKVTGSAHPGIPLALTARLPYAAVAGLEHGAQESLAMTLTATDGGGTATSSSEISKLNGVPAAAQPAQMAWTARRGLDPNGATVALDCPSTAQCTLLDAWGNGHEVTFNPLSAATRPSPVPIDADWDVACPSTIECVATDMAGNEITFNPASPPSAPHPVPMDSMDATALNVSCPTTTLCAAVETSNPSGAIGGGREITFNPASPPSNATPPIISPNVGPLWVACPAGASDVCVAVNGGQDETTFNPSSPSGARTSGIVQNDDLFAVSCPRGVTTQCTAMGNGPAYTFNPASPGKLTTLPTGDSAGWDALACPTKALCTSVDSLGRVLTFDPIINPAPTFQGLDIDGQEALVAVSCPVNPANPAQFECVALDDAGNVFVGIPRPPKPPRPSCTLSPTSNQVLLPAKNSQPTTGREGKLFFKARCSPTARIKLTGKLTEVVTSNGKEHTSAFWLPRVTGSARAGSTLPLTVTLPRATVTGLEQNAHESVRMTLTASDAGGAATVTITMPRLVGKRV